MLITNDFVMLNFPKTGSSFARDAIKRLYQNYPTKLPPSSTNCDVSESSVIELMLPKIDEANHYGVWDQHGTLRQIPLEYQHKPVLSVMRNPVSRYESTYFFRWWEKYPPTSYSEIVKHFPNFPQLSFADYYEMMHIFGRENRLQGISPKIDLGLMSIQFIQFYFKNPQDILKKIDDCYIDSKQYTDDIACVTFIHQENLRKELMQFLVRTGIPACEVEFIETMQKVNVTERAYEARNEKAVIDAHIMEKIVEREKLIFTIFNQYLC